MKEQFFLTIWLLLGLLSVWTALRLVRGRDVGAEIIYFPALGALVMMFLLPLFLTVSTGGVERNCRRSISALHFSLILYAGDHDGAYPVPSRWFDLTRDYRRPSGTAVCNTREGNRPVHYGFNGHLRKLDQDDQDVLVIAHARSQDRNALIRSNVDLHPGNHDIANIAAVGAKDHGKNRGPESTVYWEPERKRIVQWPDPMPRQKPSNLPFIGVSVSLWLPGLTGLVLAIRRHEQAGLHAVAGLIFTVIGVLFLRTAIWP